MPCKNCKYYDENERSGQKGYCEYYRRYFYEDDNCNHYVQRSGGGGGCFFTSACCEYKGLTDDCHQLTVLRSFRDGYLQSIPGGSLLINEYYSIAPKLVSMIEADSDKNNELEYIFKEVEKCVSLIENQKNQEAIELYCNMVNLFKNKYIGG